MQPAVGRGVAIHLPLAALRTEPQAAKCENLTARFYHIPLAFLRSRLMRESLQDAPRQRGIDDVLVERGQQRAG